MLWVSAAVVLLKAAATHGQALLPFIFISFRDKFPLCTELIASCKSRIRDASCISVQCALFPSDLFWRAIRLATLRLRLLDESRGAVVRTRHLGSGRVVGCSIEDWSLISPASGSLIKFTAFHEIRRWWD
jgi:hypothetical protein